MSGRSLSELVAVKATESSNNFMILRFFAAYLVIYGHSPFVAAPRDYGIDIFKSILNYYYAGAAGLHIFFIISGFLVTKSFVENGNLREFLLKRIVRIYPALLVCVLMCVVFMGVLFTELPVLTFLVNRYTWLFLANATLLGEFSAYLPLVKFTEQAHGLSVNGSLWSLFIEVRLYLMVALLGVVGFFHSRVTANCAIFGGVLLVLLVPEHLPMMPYNGNNLQVCGFFVAGSLVYINRNYIKIDHKILLMLILATTLSFNDPVVYKFFFIITLCYGVFYVAYGPKIPLPGFVQDYSYGIYLYGWPTQQLLAFHFPAMGPIGMTVLALPISTCLGALSWFLVEKPCLDLKRRWRRGAAP